MTTCPLCSKPSCRHWAPIGYPVDSYPLASFATAPSAIVDEVEAEAEIERAGLAYRAWRKLWLKGARP